MSRHTTNFSFERATTEASNLNPANGQVSCVLLCRVSSKEQEESGYSLPAQERLLTEYAHRHGMRPERVYHIAESAAGKTQRRIFGEMLAYLRKMKIRRLICEKVDRLTRNNRDAVVVDDWLEEEPERQVHFVKDSLILHRFSRSQDKLNWGIRVVMAKNYSDNLSEEVRKGRDEKFAQGIYPGPSPFGYKAVEGQGQRRKAHELDPVSAPWAKLMFDLVDTEGYSLRRLEAHLRQIGVTVPSGRPISRSNLHRYLTDPFYYGDIVWDGKQSKGSHEPLITRAQWDRVQARLRRGDAVFRYNVHNHLFKGLLRCSGCGGLITWEKHKGRYTYGHCNGYRSACPERARMTTWPTEGHVEAQARKHLAVLKVRNEIISDYIADALQQCERTASEHRAAVRASAEAAFARAQQRLKTLYEDRLDGRITTAFYDAKVEEIQRERARHEEALTIVTKATNTGSGSSVALPNAAKSPSDQFSLSQRALPLFVKGEADEKRIVPTELFDGLTLDGGGTLHVRYKESYEVLLRAVQQTNSSKIRISSLPSPASFELVKVGSGTRKNGCLTRSCPTWRDRWDEFRAVADAQRSSQTE